MLNVVVDQSGVAPWSVKTFPEIFEEDPHEHGADGQSHDYQCDACLRLRRFLRISEC